MHTDIRFWILFNVFVLVMLALDLGVFNRKSHVVSVKEALIWTLIWIFLALVFNAIIYFWQGQQKALEFFTGYLVEKALSVDNIFVFIMIFSYFSIPPQFQHKVLFWGIIGALIMRVIFIFAGVALIEKFHITIYLFGALLIYTGYKMFNHNKAKIEPDKNPLLRIFKKFVPVTPVLHEDRFFVKIDGKTLCHTFVSGFDAHRNFRPHFCGGQYTGYTGYHPGPVYCLHIECVCHFGFAFPYILPWPALCRISGC